MMAVGFGQNLPITRDRLNNLDLNLLWFGIFQLHLKSSLIDVVVSTISINLFKTGLFFGCRQVESITKLKTYGLVFRGVINSVLTDKLQSPF